MYKFVTILLSVLVFQVVLGREIRTQEERIREAQDILQLIRSVSDDASNNSAQNVQVENQQVKVVLISEVNELAHHVHEVAYHLQQIVPHNEYGQDQQALLNLIDSLNNIVHGAQQALQREPNQLQSELRTQLGNVVTQAEKLVPIVQKQQQSEDINDALLDTLDDLLVVVQQVQLRNELKKLNQQEVKSKVEAVVNDFSNSVQGVNVNNAYVSRQLTLLSQLFAEELDGVVRQLERQVRHQQGDVQNNVRQVVNKIRDIRISLGQAQTDSSGNELKSQLKTNVNNIGAQLERLVQTVQSEVVNKQEALNLRNVVNDVLAESLAAVRQLQRKLAVVVKISQDK